MNQLNRLDLVAGPLPLAVGLGALIGAVVLLWRPRRVSWKRWALVALALAAAAAVLTWAANWFVVHQTDLSEGDLPAEVLLNGGAAILAVVLALAHLVLSRWHHKLGTVVAAALVTAMAFLQINAYYGLYLTVGDITGASADNVAPLPASMTKRFATVEKEQSRPGPVAERWKEPLGLPKHGQVFSVQIPGTKSGFQSRTGFVYLPPAYRTKDRPKLPVLMLMTGQPGNPNQWLGTGNIQKIMDSYASRHRGLAPIVVMPDATGPDDEENMCMDSQIARAETYLSQDVPDWIRSTLTVDENPRRWAAAGFSFGGTCALQMATRFPQQFPNAIVMSGEAEPGIYSDRNETIQAAFNGNARQFDSLVPLTLLREQRYPGSAVYFSAGQLDQEYSGYMARTSAAARKAGMLTAVYPIPGVGHTWKVPNATLPRGLEWLSGRLGLETPSHPAVTPPAKAPKKPLFH
ncbi:alpha/beta hydrolase [Arthrobacter sp. UM1]|uniref:alpha/beta hydrolase n=1 Tax=Arthrobacter sp. UM1 TaxID=2766776 RepID=UPI001CF6A5C0|nr:alpha/beta hydrolase-fold protein [Arthrobacter sp. UM1]MCB4207910.1 esterase [Arthrobacter sp. UM1]